MAPSFEVIDMSAAKAKIGVETNSGDVNARVMLSLIDKLLKKVKTRPNCRRR